ncbi:related to pathogenicity MAP kinase 1 [Fusarium mangiferae]|uniref:Related to pathogenicity MAP kinase 1 n=1 Tax=Fusarium mangiferae TaxID=192010 RepID=A0A1L7UEH9_FUSMA|nr:uncharacterized protein FMAN_15410 [Fusarium mangiferae]CVL09064.1 related to pathogenicity MAP kinase 1 [Fusarium mangiferae]
MADSNFSGFNVSNKYHIGSILGSGAYGIVRSAVHRPSGQKVAIKRIELPNIPIFCLRALREIKLLRRISHENIISILDIERPYCYSELTEIYIVQEIMDTDLHKAIKSQLLTDDHGQFLIYQSLCALKALHSLNIIHRDLKPSNILLSEDCDLKICDFGLSRSTKSSHQSQGFMTEYVVTRWYRAPELMWSPGTYTNAIDIWSLGCIFAEILRGRPIFPGKHFLHQLSTIFDILGSPTAEFCRSIRSPHARNYILSMPYKSPVPFRDLFPTASSQAIDLLQKMLTLDPSKRITAKEALKHPYVEMYYDPADEPNIAFHPGGSTDLIKAEEGLCLEEIKRLISEEIDAIQTQSEGYY